MKEKIEQLKRQRNAVILAHNYTPADVQDIADYTGDSLELARIATNVDADMIVLCGVYFMAETAAILNPTKTVLIPNPSAGCPMADMINASQLRELKAKHPGAVAACYVNSTAEVKAECDICVTSGNAEKVMSTIGREKEIIFVPDRHLGSHVSGKEGREYILWQGHCPIHNALACETVLAMKAKYPNVPVLVHPECPKSVRDVADYCLSTGGMCKFARESSESTFLIGTEIGILHRLRKENPNKVFIPVSQDLVCNDMKKITLEGVYSSLNEMKHKVVVPDEIATKARRAIEAMLKAS